MGTTDETLMAYADGELSPVEAASVERAVAEDEALAAKLALFLDSRSAVKRAFGAPPAVPTELEARVRALAAASEHSAVLSSSNVIDLASRRRVVPFWQLPAAAMLALAIGAGSVWLTHEGNDGAAGLQVAGLSDPAIVEALREVPSGERKELEGGAEFAAIASYRDGENRLCREFEHDRPGGTTVVAVACRSDETWDVRFAIAAATADAEGYAPASSLETLDAYLTATGAGSPLSAEEEATALGAAD